ncbi:MAG: hypothetical protein K0U41_02265 [Gammaproteobacteria bacterium]|nr:hypothetical protein [Gammaproteobacteria bacterium]
MISRGIFRYKSSFTVVRPIRVTSKVTLNPGDNISYLDYKILLLQRWWNLRRIGLKDSEWVKEVLANKDPFFKPELKKQVSEKSKEPEDFKSVIIPKDSENVKPWEVNKPAK